MNITPTELAAYNARRSGSTLAPRAKRGTGKAGRAKAASALESRFLDRWTLLNGPPLEREYRAVPGRKWRFDFARIASRTLIEIHGATFAGGRHVTGTGFAADRRKMNAASELGWWVVELTAADLTADRVERLIRAVGEREGKG